MPNVTREYLVLFNAITDAEESLRHLRAGLIAAQQRAEDLFLEGAEDPEGAEAAAASSETAG